MKQKVLVGISGGVDSSVALYLLIKQGFEPVGFTLKVISDREGSKFDKELERTALLCKNLKIKHIINNVKHEFYDKVITYFADTYMAGFTPNPCVVCNRVIKWKFLLEEADKSGINMVATGHYVRIVKNENRFELCKGLDSKKDQSYYLWQLSPRELSRTIFPLGDLTKNQVHKIAMEHNLVPETLSESQGICFVPDNDYRKYLLDNFSDKLDKVGEGDLVNPSAEVLGKHNGFYNFTIGQRKGFKMGFNARHYVKEINAEKNQIVIAKNEELNSIGMIIDNINFPSGEFRPDINGNIKIRYNSKAVGCTGEMIDNDEIKIIFDTPQRAVTPGQSAVLYNGDKVIFGGLIKKIL